MIRNSFNSLAEQIIKLQNNSIEILAALNQVTSSNESEISIEQFDENDQKTVIMLPTIASYKADVDRLEQTLRTITSVDARGAIIQPARNQYKKIIAVDMNREPNPIPDLATINNFIAEKNWFFDGLLNPILKVRLDLANKVENNVRKILSRRYIINYELNSDGQFTVRGQAAIDQFNEIFKNRTDITIDEIESWLVNTPGIRPNKNGALIDYDEQEFDLDPNSLQYDGFFTILGTDEDTINRKLWFLLDTLDYQEVGTNQKKTLQLNDEVIINTDFATTRLKVIDINNNASEIRVRFENVEGSEPMPVGIRNGLRFYSSILVNKKVDISIGFNEYNIIFVKAINTENYLISRNWSRGVAYFTNDLSLISTNNLGDNGKSMQEFYIQTVSDFGEILKDAVNRIIPRHLGLKPNAPILADANFKVVQINKHLTDTPDLDKSRKLHEQVKSLRSQLDELNKTIIEKRKALVTKNYKSAKDRTNDENQLAKLIQDSESTTQLLNTAVSEILANNQANSIADPKFRVIGFWDVPTPVEDGRTRPQEVIQFKVEYKYSAKSGQEPPNEAFKFNKSDGTIQNVVFSPWTPSWTAIRERSFDVSTQKLTWENEDLSNIDKPNINSLLLSLNPNERIEIRVKSISEAGFPDSIIESDWSNVLTVTFPDELVQARKPEELILKTAEAEGIINRITTDLNRKGLDTHLSDVVAVNNKTYLHVADNVAIKDTAGNLISLTDKIKQLEQSESVEAENAVVLSDPWANYGNGYGNATYYKNNNRVYLDGLIRVVLNNESDFNNRFPNIPIRAYRNLVNAQYAEIGFLPVGYRPSVVRMVDVLCLADATELRDPVYGRLELRPNGQIFLGDGYSGWLKLDGVSFKL